MRALLTFFLISIFTGIFAVGGSILGGLVLGQSGLFFGAIVAGILGVVLSGLVAVKFKLVQASGISLAMVGGVLGYLLASALAVYGSRTFNNAIVPVLSVFLVGLGFLLVHCQVSFWIVHAHNADSFFYGLAQG